MGRRLLEDNLHKTHGKWHAGIRGDTHAEDAVGHVARGHVALHLFSFSLQTKALQFSSSNALQVKAYIGRLYFIARPVRAKESPHARARAARYTAFCTRVVKPYIVQYTARFNYRSLRALYAPPPQGRRADRPPQRPSAKRGRLVCFSQVWSQQRGGGLRGHHSRLRARQVKVHCSLPGKSRLGRFEDSRRHRWIG